MSDRESDYMRELQSLSPENIFRMGFDPNFGRRNDEIMNYLNGAQYLRVVQWLLMFATERDCVMARYIPLILREAEVFPFIQLFVVDDPIFQILWNADETDKNFNPGDYRDSLSAVPFCFNTHPCTFKQGKQTFMLAREIFSNTKVANLYADVVNEKSQSGEIYPDFINNFNVKQLLGFNND